MSFPPGDDGDMVGVGVFEVAAVLSGIELDGKAVHDAAVAEVAASSAERLSAVVLDEESESVAAAVAELRDFIGEGGVEAFGDFHALAEPDGSGFSHDRGREADGVRHYPGVSHEEKLGAVDGKREACRA